MVYRIVTTFETLYTREREVKIESTPDLQAAKGAFSIYLMNPEVVSCTLDRVPREDCPTAGHIIAAYNPRA